LIATFLFKRVLGFL